VAVTTAPVEREGLSLRASFTRGDEPGSARDGGEGRAALTVVDTTTGAPVPGLRLRAWIDERPEGAPAPDDALCRQKVTSFASGLLSAEPAADLDGYLVVSLNDDQTLSIIDPRVALARTKLRNLVSLPGDAADWVSAPDGRSIFVTIPGRDAVVAVDVLSGRIRDRLDAGSRPTRIEAGKDGRSLWVGSDGDGTIRVLDALEPTSRQTLRVGEGHHEMAFAAGGRQAFLSAADSEVVTVVDTDRLAPLGEIPVGRGVVALAASDEAKVVLAARQDGELVMIDAETRAVTRRIAVGRGASFIAFAPGGRFAWVAQRDADAVLVLDVSTGTLVRTMPGLSAPDHVAFTSRFAYVRERRSSHLSLIGLQGIEGTAPTNVVHIPLGQGAPVPVEAAWSPNPLALLPEGGGVIVAHAADQAFYGYVEGMMAPVATHPNYGRAPRAVLVVDRSLRETAPGIYSAPARLDHGGVFDLAVLLEAPRKVAACLELRLPETGTHAKKTPLVVEPLFDPEAPLVAGRPTTLRFRLRDPSPRGPLKALFARDPRGYAWRGVPTAAEDGAYTLTVTPPDPGRYQLVVSLDASTITHAMRSVLRLGVIAAATTEAPLTLQSQGGAP
jgi:DNA-binding beta-propeller fold protein YncE